VSELSEVSRRIAIQDQGSLLQTRLPRTLANMIVVDAQNQDDCDVVACALVLSHCADIVEIKRSISSMLDKYSTAIFLEPSTYRKDYLSACGLKNFHAGFDSNISLPLITVDLFSEVPSVYSLSHFGCNVAYDSSASWLVPLDYPRNVFPREAREDHCVQLEFPVYEFSCFVCTKFGAPGLNVEDDLPLIEKHYLRTPWFAANININNWRSMFDVGTEVYTTSSSGHYPTDLPPLAVNRQRVRVDYKVELPDHAAPDWVATTVPRFNMAITSLRNVVITGTGAVISEKTPIGESAYLLPLMFGPDAVRNGMTREHSNAHIRSPVLAAINSVSDNYYHWVAQAVPFLEVSRQNLVSQGISEVTIVTGRTLPFHEESIRTIFNEFDRVTIVRLAADEFLAAEIGWFSNILSREAPHNVIYEQLSAAARIKSVINVKRSSQARRIYIARTDTKARKILNETDLISELERRGYEILTLSTMPWEKQIDAFSNASIIVGGHGAGLTNILFSTEQAHLLELQQLSYANSCMMRLAQNAGLAYSALFFEDSGTAGQPKNSWFVDLKRIENELDGIEKEAGMVPPPPQCPEQNAKVDQSLTSFLKRLMLPSRH
jgi:capsular polysaccharide biosynthesis protein